MFHIFAFSPGKPSGMAPLLHRGDPHDRAEQRSHCRFLHTSRDPRAYADWLARAVLRRAPVSGRRCTATREEAEARPSMLAERDASHAVASAAPGVEPARLGGGRERPERRREGHRVPWPDLGVPGAIAGFFTVSRIYGRTEQTNAKFHRLTESSIKTSKQVFLT